MSKKLIQGPIGIKYFVDDGPLDSINGQPAFNIDDEGFWMFRYWPDDDHTGQYCLIDDDTMPAMIEAMQNYLNGKKP